MNQLQLFSDNINQNQLKKTGKEALLVLANILVAMLLGSILILLQGENPFQVYYYLLIEPLTRMSGVIKVLGKATPLIFCGLAAAVSFRSNLFNVGIEGQIYMGGLAAVLVAFFVPVQSSFIMIPMCLMAAMIAGGLWSMLAGWLKVKYKVHEVISTIMMNYIVSSIVSFVILNYLKADGANPRTDKLPGSALLTQFKSPDHLNTGFIIALICTVVLAIIVYRTATGWKIDAAGRNMKACLYSGISAKRVIMMVMMLSGMFAGLAGAERVMGAYGYMEIGFSPGYGYDGMIVAIIGRNNPIGSLIAALFIGLLHYGGVNINIHTNIASEWVYVLIAMILVMVVAGKGIYASVYRMFTSKRKADK